MHVKVELHKDKWDATLT